MHDTDYSFNHYKIFHQREKYFIALCQEFMNYYIKCFLPRLLSQIGEPLQRQGDFLNHK